MKKLTLTVVATIFLLAMMISTPVNAAPDTLYVGSGGDYATIQEAVDSASPGDTIEVLPGTYYENVVISTNDIILTGQLGAILDGSSSGDVGITFDNTSGVTVEGFEIQYYHGGITVGGSSGNIIQSNDIHDISSMGDGISLFNANDNQILNNTFTNCLSSSIWLGPQHDEQGNFVGPGSTNNLISGNEISIFNGGILLEYSHNNQVLGNTVSDPIDPPNSTGIHMGHGASENLVSGNMITDCHVGINIGNAHFNQVLGNTVSNTMNGIGLNPDETGISPSNNLISGNTVSWCEFNSIVLANAHNNQVLNNTIEDCEIDGIWLGPDESGNGSSFNLVSGNTISRCHGGIIVDSSHNNEVLGNTVLDSLTDGPGIFIGIGASANLVSGNIITNCNDGINLGNAQSNQVLENMVNSSKSGIFLDPDHTGIGPTGNTIGGNVINSCEVGVGLVDAHNNQIFRNTVSNSVFNAIILERANLNEVIENEIGGAGESGILLIESVKNSVSGNEVSDCKFGIFLAVEVNNNKISENTVENSGKMGIIGVGNSQNNLIKGNTVSDSVDFDLFEGINANNKWKKNEYETSNF